MEIIIHPAGIYGANCYIVFDNEANEGFIIDPGGDPEGILGIVRDRGLNIKFILLTHGHFDHNGGVKEIKDTLNIPVYMNERDSFLVTGNDEITKLMVSGSASINIDHYIKDGDNFSFGKKEMTVLETPGHTPGSVTIAVEGNLFTGDTLFLGSVGRTDLPGGSHEELIRSIKDELLTFPDETKVYPGHGSSSTIGSEKKHNPFLN